MSNLISCAMKKFLLLSLFLTFLLIRCEKEKQSVPYFEEFISELTEISNSSTITSLSFSPCNELNRFDNLGENLYYKLDKFFLGQSLKAENSIESFKTGFYESIPKEFFINESQTALLDKKKIDKVFHEFISALTKRNINEALPLFKKMEGILILTPSLNNDEKNLLLKMTSILRFSTFLVANNLSTKGSFEDCWIRKLREIENSGFFEKVSCAFAWPACFAYKLADCALEEIEDHLIE